MCVRFFTIRHKERKEDRKKREKEVAKSADKDLLIATYTHSTYTHTHTLYTLLTHLYSAGSGDKSDIKKLSSVGTCTEDHVIQEGGGGAGPLRRLLVNLVNVVVVVVVVVRRRRRRRREPETSSRHGPEEPALLLPAHHVHASLAPERQKRNFMWQSHTRKILVSFFHSFPLSFLL